MRFSAMATARRGLSQIMDPEFIFPQLFSASYNPRC